jgi:hypothetical protein
MADEKDKRAEDKKLLIECLKMIEEQLQFIVFHLPEKFRQEFRQEFPGPWEEVQRRFASARDQIEKDEIDWQYVEGVGLTSSTLKWKSDLLDKARRGGVLRRFLDMANSFLGSLSGALPIVEFIKEYKDMVEASLRIVRSVE